MVKLDRRILGLEFLIPAILVMVLVGTGALVSLERYWSIADDHLQFLMTGVAVTHHDQIDGDLGRVEGHFAEAQMQGPAVESLAVRHDNLQTYLGVSTLYAAVSGLLGSAPTEPEAFAEHLVLVNLLGYAVATLGLALIVSLICVRVPQAGWLIAGGLLVSWGIHMALPWSGYAELGASPVRFLKAFLNPGAVWGVFGFTPKNNLILVVIAVFGVRVTGRYGLGYGLALLALLVHRQMGMLLLASLLVTDGFIRPALFRKAGILVCLALSFSYFLGMESFWERMGLTRGLGVVLGAVAVLLGVGAARLVERWHPAPWGSKTLVRNAFADVMVFLLLFAAISGIAWFGQQSGQGSARYFWGQLPIRTLLIYQPMAVMSVVILVWSALRARLASDTLHRASLGLGGVVLVLAPLVCWASLERSLGGQIERRVRQALEIDGRLDLGLRSSPGYRDEDEIYFAVIRDAWTPQVKAVDRLLVQRDGRDLVTSVALGNVSYMREFLEKGGCDVLTRSHPYTWPLGGSRTGWLIDIASAWNARDVVDLLLDAHKSCNIDIGLQPHCNALEMGHGSLFNLLSKTEAFAMERRECVALPGRQ